MKTLFMTVGLPASGKTTWAKGKMSEHPGAYKRVNKDDLRAMVDGGKWSHDNERFIIGIRDYIVTAALNAGKHVIVDDTNLAPKHQERLRQLAKQGGAAFELVDFTSVSVAECIERDRKRSNYVGERVIRDMWRQFLAPKMEAVERNPDLPDCVLVDIDGTVALMNGRGPFDWAKVGSDIPHAPVCTVVRWIAERQCNPQLVFVSGRDEICRAETWDWMRRVFGSVYPLHMRPAGDMSDDRIIKRDIYDREIKGRYNVLFVLDDRNKVVDQWRQMGLPCFQVADGDF